MPSDADTGEVAPEPSPLVVAVCAVMAEVGYVKGTGWNTAQKYSFTSDADLVAPLQTAMSNHGLMICPAAVDLKEGPREGGSGRLAVAIVTYALRHVDGEVITIQAPGCGFDSLDKAPYKAMTGAFKYALRQTFVIPTGDDAEQSESKKSEPRNEPSRPPPADPENRAKLQKLWHATLGRFVADNLTPELSTEERQMVQGKLWGVPHLADLSDADCGVQLSNMRNTDEVWLASRIRRVIGADPPQENPR